MVLVTGAGGFIGRAVCHHLQQNGIAYRAYTAEINDFVRLRFELGGADSVIHLASGETRGRDRWLAWVDIDGTNTLIEAAKHRKIDRLIVVSRINAEYHSRYALLRAKGMVEQMVRDSDIPHTIIRSATLFGRNDRFTNGIVQSATWPFAGLHGGGRTPFQPLWVNDLARCLVETLGRDDLTNQTITVAGDERLHYKEIVDMVLDSAERDRILVGIPPIISYTLNRLRTAVHDRPPITRYALERIANGEVADLETVYAQFDFRPARLQQHLSHLRLAKFGRLLPI